LNKTQNHSAKPTPNPANGLLSNWGWGQMSDFAGPNFGDSPQRMPRGSYVCLVICVLSQVATILISWPAWQIREMPPNLPWISSTPQFPTGVILLVSLAFVLISPKKFGLAIHLAILALAILMDQFRCQPQVLAIAFMMAGCVWISARRICVWYLVSMWFWAGAHKTVSPDWFSQVSYNLLSGTTLDAKHLHYGFAWVIAVSELALGILAWLKPKIAGVICIALHVGIAIFLYVIGWNYSVLPWNICTAIVGCWLLWSYKSLASNTTDQSNRRLPIPASHWQRSAIAALLILPIGLYFGIVRHCFAHALYSGNLPIALVTRPDGVEVLESWKQVRLPFPNEKKAYLDFFASTANAGEKLHIREPRRFVAGGYYLAKGRGVIQPITEQHFFETRTSPLADGIEVAGFAVDNPRDIYLLQLANSTLMKRSEGEMIYAVKFDPANFDPASLELLSGLPNLEQVQLGNCKIVDADLKWLAGFPKLYGIGLSDTSITDAGLLNLKDVPNLSVIEHEGTSISDAGLIAIGVPVQ